MATERRDSDTGGKGVLLLRYPPDDMAMGINKLVGRVVLVDLLYLGGFGL